MNTFAVIRAGTRGSGIALADGRSGFAVGFTLIGRHLKPEFLTRGPRTIGARLTREVGGRRPEAEKGRIIERIRTMTEMGAVREADFAVEDSQNELALFAGLDQITQPEVILASNTSSISITKLAAATQHRPACHEPRAGHEAGRDHPRPGDCGRDVRRDALAERLGKTPGKGILSIREDRRRQTVDGGISHRSRLSALC